MSQEKSLKRDKVLERLALIEEKKRRDRLRKPPYVPTPGQEQVLVCPQSNIFNFSGNGSGKTALNVQLAMMYARGVNPWTKEQYRVPARVAFVVDTSRKIDERIVPEINKWFDVPQESFKKEGKPYTSKLYLDNGSEIIFLTADADPMTMEGVEYSVVIVDEPFPRTLYIALKRSLRMKGHPNKFIFSGTAITEAWLRKDIYEPWRRGELPDTMCFNMKTEANRSNLAEGYIESFSRTLTEAEKKVRLEGGFFDADSLALAEFFKAEHHIIPRNQFHYDPRMPCVVAVDPHSVKPHTAVMLTIDRDDKAIAVKTLSFRGNATQFAYELKEWEKGFSVVDRVCDSLGNMEMTSGEGMHSFIEGLQANGIMIRATTFKEKNHEDLIDRLRQGLTIPDTPDQFGRKTPSLRFTEDTGPLIANIEQVTWQKNKITGEFLPKLDTSTKDFLSCLGYALAIGVKYDIIKHSKPSYRTDALPASQDKAEVEAHRKRIKENRNSRTRVRFIRRTLRGINV